MDVRINSYRPATIAPIKTVNKIKKVDKEEPLQEKRKEVIKPGEQRIDTYASYRKRKYAERIKTRFDLFL